MGAVLHRCPSRQPASRARVASRLEPQSPSAVMRQVLFAEEESEAGPGGTATGRQAAVVPEECDRSSSSSRKDSEPTQKAKGPRRQEALEAP